MDYDYGTQDESSFRNTYESDSFSYTTTDQVDTLFQADSAHYYTKDDDRCTTPEPINSDTNIIPSYENNEKLEDVSNDCLPLETQELNMQDEVDRSQDLTGDNLNTTDTNPQYSYDEYKEDKTKEDDNGCCGCSNDSWMCFAIICDCFGL